MRKGLIAATIMVILIIAGVAFLVMWYAVGPGGTSTSLEAPLDLSFKPFTLDELLHNKTKVDLKTSGKRIHSAKFELIEERTSKIRGLPLKKQVPLVEASEALIKYQLLESSLEKTSVQQTIASEKVLKALGLLAPSDSLSEIITNVLTEQIAGSYDTETKEITIVKGKGLSTTFDEITMSHEVTHALQDQNFGLDKPPLENEAYNSDEDTAVQSLVEGDATDTMYEYAKTYVSVSDLLQMQNEAEKTESPQLDKAPPYIKKGLLFPYEDGYSFVQKIKEDAGGETAVNSALRTPPMSTQQIMHPEDYLDKRHAPIAITLPDLTASLGSGWKRIDNDTLGEWDFQVWFEQFTTTATGADVADGWAGNTIQYYQGPGKSYVMPNEVTWIAEADAQLFFEEYPKLLKSRFGAKLQKIGSTSTSYSYKADEVTYYCGISGKTTLALQTTDASKLGTLLQSYPQMTPVAVP